MQDKTPEYLELVVPYATGRIADTETTLRYFPDKTIDGHNYVYVKVRPLPGFMYWSPPPAKVMRRWVDLLLKNEGVKRNGSRKSGEGWSFYYYVTDIT